MRPDRAPWVLIALAFATAAACSTQDHPIVTPPDTSTPGDTIPPGPSGITATLEYSTFLGGSRREEAREPVPLPDGRLLFSIRTASDDMPQIAGAHQPNFGGGEGDTYLAIMSPDGGALLASTYLGGSGLERPAYGMEVAPDGDVILVSGSNSTDFPVTPGAYQPTPGDPASSGYLCRLSPDLSTARWCTYVPGEPRGGLALASNGDPVITGATQPSTGYAPTAGTVQTAFRGRDDVMVLRWRADGSGPVFSTLVGGNNSEFSEVGLSVNVVGDEIILSGIAFSADFPTTEGAPWRDWSGARDGFLVRISDDGREFRYGTFFGGSGEDEAKHRNAFMPDGAIVVGGVTTSADFRGASGSFQGTSDGWVGLVDATGSGLTFLRHLGGSRDDLVVDRAVDAQGRIYVVGATSSPDFPTTAGALQQNLGGGQDGFLVILDASGTLLYGTYLGGSGSDNARGVDIGPDGGVYIVGGTASDDFPITTGAVQEQRAGDQDGFALKLAVSGG
ncbi:MAG: hypothetical protein HKN71_03780 [Gemmatimonadetes bacterium]|nr:hypothetical protein [Gemmatimonadota bacterium]